jgi:hypothetical protein
LIQIKGAEGCASISTMDAEAGAAHGAEAILLWAVFGR